MMSLTTDQIQSDGVVYLPDSTERAPMSIVWTTLPGISFLFPVIGHVGIGDSSGVTYDFSGPYQVTVGSLMGGPAKRQWILDQSKITKTDGKTVTDAFDDAVKHAACVYGKKFHNLFLDNCHHHVALVLNRIKYDGRSDWNQVRVFKSIWLKGEWVSNKERLVVFGPFVMLLLVIVLLSIIIPVTTR